jgi:hypothetical protein
MDRDDDHDQLQTTEILMPLGRAIDAKFFKRCLLMLPTPYQEMDATRYVH